MATLVLLLAPSAQAASAPPPRELRAGHGIVTVEVRCARPVRCIGRVTIETRGRTRRVLGNANYTIAPGHRARVRVHLQRKVLRRFGSRRSVSVLVVIANYAPTSSPESETHAATLHLQRAQALH